MSQGHILLIEDRTSLLRMMQTALEGEGYTVSTASTAEAGEGMLEGEAGFELVLTDLMLPRRSGLDVLATCRRLRPELPVVVLTAYGTVETAVEAMKLGASDFLEKPVELDQLFELVDGLLGEAPTEGGLHTAGTTIVGSHPRMRAAFRLLSKVAKTPSTVLLTGESGTGKELFARAVHELSPRSGGPFVAVNCAAIPETLMENELFGHEKGAFTGAHRRQKGRFELAEGGTLFLDEIGELSLAIQGKILRALEERVYERVGGSATLRADVRIVAATNRELSAMVQHGEFRSDLFHRLNVFPIALPALRERHSDIPQIAEHLVARLAERSGRSAPRLSGEAKQRLEEQEWEGNVRQLSNVLERALILTEGSVIDAMDIEAALPQMASVEPSDEAEVRRALEEADGDKQRAAEILGVSYRTLQRRIHRYDLGGYPHYGD